MILSSASPSVDLSGWKFIVGGSPLSPALAGAALDRGMDVFTGYGMSETCPILTLAQIERGDVDEADDEVAFRTKAGRPCLFVDVRIVDEQMQDVPRGKASAGEVVVRAPWLTQAYVGDPANSERLWAGGYLHTGDIGSIDGHGRLTISDRIKDVIKSGGEWVSSLEIEDLISTHPDVSEVAVIGVPDGRWGERPLAIVVPKSAASSDIWLRVITDHLQPFCDRGIISKWSMPAKVVQVDALEKTSVGKLDKKVLRARYGGPN
jgi:fatty-acyl-CoA synthase